MEPDSNKKDVYYVEKQTSQESSAFLRSEVFKLNHVFEWLLVEKDEFTLSFPLTFYLEYELSCRDLQKVYYCGKTICAYFFACVKSEKNTTQKTFGHISVLTVGKAFRRCGIAKQLMFDFEAYCKKNSFSKMELNVSTRNTSAIALYKSLDFEIAFTMHNYYNGQDAFSIFVKRNEETAIY